MLTEHTDFEAILFKIAQDDEFRHDFENDRSSVLARFRLTAAQATILVTLNIGLLMALVDQAAAGSSKPI